MKIFRKNTFSPQSVRGLFVLLSVLSHLGVSAHGIEVHGHRGARARFPENTLPAFEHALKVGVDYLEMDLGVTKDNVIVISHDPHINGVLCLDGKGKKIEQGPLLRELTLAQVKTYDCGSLKNPKFPLQTPIPQTRIPTLDEVFEMVKKSPHPAAQHVRFNIETKIKEEFPSNTVDPKTFVELFVAVVQKHNMQSRVLLQSFDFRTLHELASIAPQIPRAALTEKKFSNSVDIIRRTGAQIISPLWIFVNPRYVERLHNINTPVVPWTANSEKDWAHLIKSGVDGIITDDPENLITYLKRKGLR